MEAVVWCPGLVLELVLLVFSVRLVLVRLTSVVSGK